MPAFGLTISTLPQALLAPSSSGASAGASAGAPALSRNRAARQTAFSSYQHPDACNLPMDVCEGAIPEWLKGVYYRNGPGLFEDATGRRLEHLFDGYAMLARVALEPGRPPLLTTRFVDSEAHRAARSGEMAYAEFMTPRVPPGSGFAAVAKAFAALALGDPTDNACVSVVRRGGRLQAMSEPQRSWVEFDPVTLATERKVAWEGAEGAGQLGTAHALRDPLGGGWINVATKISPPLWNEYQASHGSVQWRPEDGTKVHVVDRRSGTVATRTLFPAFFFFHVANAFDTPDGGAALDLCVYEVAISRNLPQSPAISRNLPLDVCVYEDAETLNMMKLARLTDEARVRDMPPARLTRLTLPPPGAGADAAWSMTPLDDETVTGGFFDMPAVAPAALGRRDYRYVYGIGARRPTAYCNAMVKADVSGGGGDAAFAVEGMLAGEPTFVPRPGGSGAEDDGALLSICTDADGGTSLYVLDARDLRPLARARSPVGLPAGFHGEFFFDDAGAEGSTSGS